MHLCCLNWSIMNQRLQFWIGMLRAGSSELATAAVVELRKVSEVRVQEANKVSRNHTGPAPFNDPSSVSSQNFCCLSILSSQIIFEWYVICIGVFPFKSCWHFNKSYSTERTKRNIGKKQQADWMRENAHDNKTGVMVFIMRESQWSDMLCCFLYSIVWILR